MVLCCALTLLPLLCSAPTYLAPSPLARCADGAVLCSHSAPFALLPLSLLSLFPLAADGAVLCSQRAKSGGCCWVWWDCFSICHSHSKYNEEKTAQVVRQPYPVRDYHTLSLYAKRTCLTLTVAESLSLTLLSCLSRCCLSHCLSHCSHSHSCTFY